jgi:two-component system cell cycle sensor histidine kinase PleC
MTHPLRLRLSPIVAFAIIGAAAFVACAAVVGYIQLNRSAAQMKQMAEQNNATFTKAFANVLGPNIDRLLATHEGEEAVRLRGHPEIAKIRKAVGQAIAGTNIIKVKIYAPDGHTLFSTDPTQIGEDKSGNIGFRSAMAGRVSSDITYRDQFDAFEGTISNRDVLYSYLPVTFGSGANGNSAKPIRGVFEIYADVTAFKLQIRKTLALELITVLAGFSVIYALLLIVVVVSNKRLAKHHRKQMRLTESVARAESANRAKSEFLANVSHELRTPLNAVIGFSEMMQSEAYGPLGSDQYKSYCGDIHHSGTHLLALVNDMLDIAKIDAGELRLREEPVPLKECLQISLRMISGQPAAAGLELNCLVDDDLPSLLADPLALDQVLLNLLSNAVKFTPDGSVELSARLATDDALEIKVTDTGIGIPPDELENLTLPFYQVDSSLSRKYQGTGLGLALVKSLIELHDGELLIDSKVGVGTTIICRFPSHRTLRDTTNPSVAA